MKKTRVDSFGRVILEPDALFEMMLDGVDVWQHPTDLTDEVVAYNALCERFGRDDELLLAEPEPIDHTPHEEHQRRCDRWIISEAMRNVDVRAFLLELCRTPEECQRVEQEMDLYEEHDLIPVLQLMMYLVDHFRQNNVVWGVGRGSSVASFCLYLIGVHKIHSLRYGLSIEDFLKGNEE
jgi:DNA polymerase III alpha subunit